MEFIIYFILTGWASMYRMARARMLSLREEEYIQALKAFGVSDFVICYKHMLPNAIGPVVINITLSTAMFILEETSLSFFRFRSAFKFTNLGKYFVCSTKFINFAK